MEDGRKRMEEKDGRWKEEDGGNQTDFHYPSLPICYDGNSLGEQGMRNFPLLVNNYDNKTRTCTLHIHLHHPKKLPPQKATTPL